MICVAHELASLFWRAKWVARRTAKTRNEEWRSWGACLGKESVFIEWGETFVMMIMASHDKVGTTQHGCFPQ
jgi:hypothetical protein